MATIINEVIEHQGMQLKLNSSLRLMVTFKVLNASQHFEHHDYDFDHHPELPAAIARLLDGEKPAVAFAKLSEELSRDLGQKGIAELDKINLDNWSVLSLSKNAIVTISVFVRYADKPAERNTIIMSEHPNAVKWLIATISQPEKLPELAPKDIDILVSEGALVEKDPPPIVSYPCPETAIKHWHEQISTADQLYIQTAGAPIPDKVKLLLGRHWPELPNTDIVWTSDAGTRLVNATVAPASELNNIQLDKEQRQTIPSIKDQQKIWKQTIQIAKVDFKRNAYAQINDIIAPAHQISLRSHVRKLIEHNYFGPLDDGQVTRRMGRHNESVTASLHHRLAKLVSLVVGKKIKASYAYLGCYLDGAVLERHVDRPQCQYNLSIVFDMCDQQENTVEPWPIYLKMGKKEIAVKLNPGSGLLYQGTKIEHWRDALPAGQRAIVCFLSLRGR